MAQPSNSAGLTVVGTPFSTFTRTITLALHELGLHFTQVPAYPHTDEATAHHPFGRIPAITHNGFRLCESFAIARYIDSMAPASSRPLRPPRTDAKGNAAIDEMMSLAASYVFPAVEHGVVKPKLKMEEERMSEGAIAEALDPGLAALRTVLAVLEERGFAAAAPLLDAESPSWADLYLLPPLADLAAIPEGTVLAEFPKLSRWLGAWQQRPSYLSTYSGTLADQRTEAASGEDLEKPQAAETRAAL